MPSNKEIDFFDIPSKDQQVSQQPLSDEQQSFFDVPTSSEQNVEQTPSISEQLYTAPQYFAREGGAGLYAAPSIGAEVYRFLTDKLIDFKRNQHLKKGEEFTEKEEKFFDNLINYIPDLIKSGGEKFPNLLPTFQQAQEKIGKRLEKNYGKELSKEPKGKINKFASGIGNAVPIALQPGNAVVKGAALLTSGLTEASDLSQGKKIIGNLTIPALASIITSIARRRYTPPPGEARQLYERGRQLGMTNRQLAPILATEGQVARHGKLAAGSRNTHEAFHNTGEALGDALNDLRTRPAASIQLGTTARRDLVNSLQQRRHEIRSRTHALSPQERAAVQFLDDAISDIHGGSTNSQLIGTWRSINRSGAGNRDIQAIKGDLVTAIQSTDRQLAQDLQTTNRLYSRYLDNLRDINPGEFNQFINAGELQKLLGAVFSGDPSTLGKQVLNAASLGALRRISSSILTSPTAQSLGRNFARAVQEGSQSSALSLGNQFKEYVKKNLPEEYKEIDWDELGLGDKSKK